MGKFGLGNKMKSELKSLKEKKAYKIRTVDY